MDHGHILAICSQLDQQELQNQVNRILSVGIAEQRNMESDLIKES